MLEPLKTKIIARFVGAFVLTAWGVPAVLLFTFGHYGGGISCVIGLVSCMCFIEANVSSDFEMNKFRG